MCFLTTSVIQNFQYVVTMEQISGSKLDICSFCTIFKETPS